MTTPRWPLRILDLGTVGLSLGLLGLAAHAALLPADAAATYGIPTEGTGVAWVRAAGLRDGVLGLIVAATLRHRPVRPLVLAAALVLPIADVVLSLDHAGPAATLPHAAGLVGIAVLLGLSMGCDRVGAR